MKTKSIICIAFCWLFSTQADAFETYDCMGEPLRWRSPNASMMVHQGTMPVNGAWFNSFSTAVDRVNDNPSLFSFSLGGGWPLAQIKNGVNEAWRTIDQLVLEGDAARAIVQFNCIEYWIFGRDIEYTEADIVFHANSNYTTSMNTANLIGYGGFLRPFQNAAISLLGTALGLAREPDTYGVMGEDWSHIHANSNAARSYFGEDAGNGAVFLYGLHPAKQDLSLTHWKYAGSSGESSRHEQTGLKSSCTGGRTPLPVTIDGATGDRFHRVSPGQRVFIEMTYENNGASTQNTVTGYYVSTNNNITDFDRRIGSWSMTVGRNVVWTPCRQLTIPNDLVRGRDYWLGARIDDNETLVELTEANNATYSPIPIRIN